MLSHLTNLKKFKELTMDPIVEIIDPDKFFTEFEEIGRGSFSSVYRTKIAKTDQIMAVKKFLFTNKTLNEDVEDIFREIFALKNIDHPNCIFFHGVYMTNSNDLFLGMEFCIGSVHDALKITNVEISEKLFSEIVYSILSAFCYIHGLGYIHRDIKAGNVLIGCDHTIKIADFGSVSLSPKSSSFAGSPYWMAPELLLAMDAKDYDCKADIWSLGITCIEIIEKVPPHFNVHQMAAIYTIVQDDPPKFNSPSYSSNLINLINSLLVKDPKSRPSSNALLEKLKTFYDYPEKGNLEVKKFVKNLKNVMNSKLDCYSNENQEDNESNEDNDSEITSSEEGLDELKLELDELQELVDNINKCENSFSYLEEEAKKSFVKLSRENSVLMKKKINSKSFHLKQLEKLDQIDIKNLYTKLTETYMKKIERDNILFLQRLVRKHQEHLSDLENKNSSHLKEMISSSKKDFIVLIAAFEEDMDNLKQRHAFTLDKYIKTLLMCTNDKCLQKQQSCYKGCEKLDIKSPVCQRHPSNFSTLEISQNKVKVELSPSNVSMDEKLLKRRQMKEVSLLQEEIALLTTQTREAHKFLLKTHENLVSLQTARMEKVHSLRLSQTDKKVQTELNNFNIYKEEYLKTLTKYHIAILKSTPKYIKKNKENSKRNEEEFIKNHKCSEKLEFKKSIIGNSDSEIKRLRSLHKSRLETFIKEFKASKAKERESYEKDIYDKVISKNKEEMDDFLRKINKSYDWLIKLQEKHLSTTKEQMFKERCKLVNSCSLRKKSLLLKIDAEKKNLNELIHLKANVLRAQHEADDEKLSRLISKNKITDEPEHDTFIKKIFKTNKK